MITETGFPLRVTISGSGNDAFTFQRYQESEGEQGKAGEMDRFRRGAQFGHVQAAHIQQGARIPTQRREGTARLTPQPKRRLGQDEQDLQDETFLLRRFRILLILCIPSEILVQKTKLPALALQ
jgi:hypothetical protein